MITTYPPQYLTDTQLRASQVPVQNRPSPSEGIRRFGTNTAVGTSFVSIDNIGVSTPHMPTTASIVEVLSNSANDTLAGSGARTVEIFGIGSAWQFQTETLMLNGTTPVQSVNTYYRVMRITVKTVGSYGASNAGNILARVTGAGPSFCQIDTGNGQSFTSHFTCPAGYYGAITGANLSSDSGKAVTVKVLARDNAQNTVAPFSPVELTQYFEGLTGTNHFDYDPPIIFGPTTDVWLQAKVATGSAAVSVEYWGWIAPI